MAGSDKTGDKMEAGRVNRAEDSTNHWAQRRNGSRFDGTAILIVEPARDFAGGFEAIVNQRIEGIRSIALGGGAGIVGFSSPVPVGIGLTIQELSENDLDHATGAGVFGKGTTGVVGQGVSAAGVIGRGGGPNLEPGTRRPLLGTGKPGVMGFAGEINETEELNPTAPNSTGVVGLGGTGVSGRGFLRIGARIRCRRGRSRHR